MNGSQSHFSIHWFNIFVVFFISFFLHITRSPHVPCKGCCRYVQETHSYRNKPVPHETNERPEHAVCAVDTRPVLKGPREASGGDRQVRHIGDGRVQQLFACHAKQGVGYSSLHCIVKTAQKDAIGSGTVTDDPGHSLRGVVCRFDSFAYAFSAGVNTRTCQPPANHSPLVVRFEKKC